MFTLGKCVFIFCIIFMMCPKRIRPALAVQKLQQDYYHARRGRGPFSNVTNKFSSIRKHGKTYRDPNDQDKMKGIIYEEARNDGIISGFDLTDEEMIKFKIWPQGVIPYYIDVISFKDKVLRDKIRGFLNVVNGLTGLNFLELLVPPQDEKRRWVFFINRRGLLDCADHSIKNFTNEGVQHVILGYDCMSTRGELADTVLAIAGIPSQHNAPNRDEYIRVVEDNIMPEKIYLFEKLNDNEWLFHDIAYDFYSAGHYHSHKYSANGRATIETKKKIVDIPVGEVEFAQSNNELSNSDIRKIKMMYSYISQKKQAHIPECHKLFQPGKHFGDFKPINNNISPQKKPGKYLGIADDEKNVTDDAEKDAVDEKNDNNDSNNGRFYDNENMKNKSDEEDDEEKDKEDDEEKDKEDNEEKDKEDDEEKDKEDNEEKDKEDDEEKDKEDDEEKDKEDDEEKNKEDDQEDDDKDNESDNTKQTERNTSEKVINKPEQDQLKDPITYLSDYQTENENPKKRIRFTTDVHDRYYEIWVAMKKKMRNSSNKTRFVKPNERKNKNPKYRGNK